jgi:hypothetical protein
MVAIPFPVSSAPGWRSQEGAGRLINCFAEPVGEGDTASTKRVRVPGLTEFLTSSQTGFRGMAEMGSLYVGFAGQLYRGTSSGGPLVLHGTLGGTQSVYFARNNNDPPDKVVVTEAGAFVIIDPSTINNYPDVDLPQPNGVCSIDGYLVFTTGAGQIFASDLNSTEVNALSFGEANVKPDPPVRPIAYGGRLLIFGHQSLEIWLDVGTSPFPFQRSVTIPNGLIGPDAVAGWEDGWGAGLLWVADDCTVRQLDGYTAVKVSPPDLDRLLGRDPLKIALLASVYMVDGHAMWSVTGTGFTWTYDISTKKWHERASWQDVRWRAKQSVNAYDRWLVGDRYSGNILAIDPTNHFEGGVYLPLRIESAPVQKFPQRVRVARADFHLETGVGITTGLDPIQIDPVVMISYSDDGGLNWSDPMHRKMGRQAVDQMISVFRTGMTSRHGRRWRLDISDPVYVAVFGGDMSAEPRGPGG